MWVKKHAPKTFDEVVGNPDIVKRFKGMCKSGYMQHMILCGPSGVGKNTLLHLLIHHILGEQHEDGTLLFTSADNKSNQHVREKIHQFVPKKISNARTKFVVFKQAELLSEGVQQVMRRLMEQHYHHTVFVFVCNSIGNLLETIQSRCHIYRFKHISPEDQRALMIRISEREKYAYDDDACTRIIKMSNGDLRFSLNYMQVCYASTVATNACLFPYYNCVDKIFTTLLDPQISKDLGTFHQCLACVKELADKGYCGRDIVIFLTDYIVANDSKIPRGIALECIKHIELCKHRMQNGADSFLQICAMLAMMYDCILHNQAST